MYSQPTPCTDPPGGGQHDEVGSDGWPGWIRAPGRRSGMSLGQDETLGSEATLVKSRRGDSGLQRPRIPAADHKPPVPGLSVTVVSRPSLSTPGAGKPDTTSRRA